MNPDHKFKFIESDLHRLFQKSKFKEYHVVPLFLGLMTRIFGKTIDIEFERPPWFLRKYCNQYGIQARKK